MTPLPGYMPFMNRADVIILGGGMVGLALAAALDGAGLSSIVVDPADPALRRDLAFDGRTSAVSSSSMRMLSATGVADHLPAAGCPILAIRVADGLAPGGLTFEPDEDGEPLGVVLQLPRVARPPPRRPAAAR